MGILLDNQVDPGLSALLAIATGQQQYAKQNPFPALGGGLGSPSIEQQKVDIQRQSEQDKLKLTREEIAQRDRANARQVAVEQSRTDAQNLWQQQQAAANLQGHRETLLGSLVGHALDNNRIAFDEQQRQQGLDQRTWMTQDALDQRANARQQGSFAEKMHAVNQQRIQKDYQEFLLHRNTMTPAQQDEVQQQMADNARQMGETPPEWISGIDAQAQQKQQELQAAQQQNPYVPMTLNSKGEIQGVRGASYQSNPQYMQDAHQQKLEQLDIANQGKIKTAEVTAGARQQQQADVAKARNQQAYTAAMLKARSEANGKMFANPLTGVRNESAAQKHIDDTEQYARQAFGVGDDVPRPPWVGASQQTPPAALAPRGPYASRNDVVADIQAGKLKVGDQVQTPIGLRTLTQDDIQAAGQ